MRFSSIKARRQVRFRIVAYCNELFEKCTVEKIYYWGNYLDCSCPEAQEIIRIARTKLGYKKTYNSRDLFWVLQCTWRKMKERNLIEKYTINHA